MNLKTVGLMALIVSNVEGCSEDSPGGRESSSFHAVGEVISVPAAALDGLPIWQFSQTPVLLIGDSNSDGPCRFDRIAAASRMEDGKIVVAESRSHHLRLFDEGGNFLRQFGGTGSGPGEFQMWMAISAVDSNLIGILDVQGRETGRITVYNLSEGQVLVEPYPQLPCAGDRGRLEGSCDLIGVFPNGSAILAETTRSTPFTLPTGELTLRLPSTSTYFVYDDKGLHKLDTIPTSTTVRHLGEQVGLNVPYFSAEALFKPKGIAALGVNSIIFGTTDRFEIRQWSRTGALIRTIRVIVAPVPVTDELLQPFLTWADTADAAQEPARAYIRSLRPEGWVPFFGDLLIDRVGRIWVQNYRSSVLLGPRVTKHWTVFSTEGWPIAEIDEFEDARRARVLEIGEDYLLAAIRDEGGGEFFAKYRIESGR